MQHLSHLWAKKQQRQVQWLGGSQWVTTELMRSNGDGHINHPAQVDFQVMPLKYSCS
jgi:hypothetical protein